MSGRGVRAVSFDATGTLIHSPRLGEIYSEVLARHGYAVTPARARSLVRTVWQELDIAAGRDGDCFASHPGGARGWWRRFLERFCEHLGGPPPSRFAAAELFDRFAAAAAWEVYPDVRPALAALRRSGLALAVIANWDERLPALLEALGLGDAFATVVTSQGAGVRKPHPLIFQTALGLLDLAPEEVLHVGDRRLEDVEGAQALGMRAVWLTRDAPGGIRGLAGIWGQLQQRSPC
ncbi:MAG: HAD-IA family hydrolase [Acidobacteriota bacterium]|nr:HAD-IA family hydrolase [Acidobacteriota bacterium]MDH3525799.1 HAD-IA family hydrolase [Acidobacteriota bacterium]